MAGGGRGVRAAGADKTQQIAQACSRSTCDVRGPKATNFILSSTRRSRGAIRSVGEKMRHTWKLHDAARMQQPHVQCGERCPRVLQSTLSVRRGARSPPPCTPFQSVQCKMPILTACRSL